MNQRMTSPKVPGPKGLTKAEDAVVFWSDIGCPWATLALATLHAAAEARGIGVTIDHRPFPLELFNRRPTPKPILDAEIVAIGGVVPELGWTLWASDPSSYPVTTLPALEAVQAAKAPVVGGLEASDELDGALRRALYTQSRCISVHAVVLEVAEECSLVDHRALERALARGAGRAEVYAGWRRAHSSGVLGSPHLFIGDLRLHNAGVNYHWTAPPGQGFPRLVDYDRSWVDAVLARLNVRETS